MLAGGQGAARIPMLYFRLGHQKIFAKRQSVRMPLRGCGDAQSAGSLPAAPHTETLKPRSQRDTQPHLHTLLVRRFRWRSRTVFSRGETLIRVSTLVWKRAQESRD